VVVGEIKRGEEEEPSDRMVLLLHTGDYAVIHHIETAEYLILVLACEKRAAAG
jgi:hypothetical protein